MDNTDLEQQCEDALIEVCDARERYPLRCINELAKSIQLTNEIQSAKVVLEKDKSFDNEHITQVQHDVLKECLLLKTITSTQHNKNLENILNKIENLNMVVDQLENEKNNGWINVGRK